MSDYLPQDVQLEILSRLPAKSLMRFKCVCKEWNSLISSPEFSQTHLKNSAMSNSHILLRYYSLTYHTQVFTLHSPSALSFNEIPNQFIRSPITPDSTFYFRIVGSCNGLLCLVDDIFGYTNTIFLWNPSIRKHLELPHPRVNTEVRGSIYRAHYMCVYGFGFDDKNDDHKLVRLGFWKGQRGFRVPAEVEIFTLKERRWRDFEGVVPRFGATEYFYSQVFLNGKVHWVAYRRNDDSRLESFVVWFDLSDDMFGEMPLPERLAGEFVAKMSVILLNGKLSVLQVDECVDSKLCTVWVMEEYGVVESWSKLCAIDLQRRIVKTLGMASNGDLLLAVGSQFSSYDHEKKVLKDLGIHGTTDSFHVENYVESLVLLDEGRKDGIDVIIHEILDYGVEMREYEMQFFLHADFVTTLHDF